MNIVQSDAKCSGIKFTAQDEEGKKVGRAFLYIMHNDLHDHPFGLLEDVYVEDDARGRGFGKTLIKEVIEAAKSAGCYKLIATSRHARPKVHEMYVSLGFYDRGKEFRIDF